MMHLEEGLGAGELQHAGDVEVVLGDRPDADGGVEHGGPHGADGDGEQRTQLGGGLAGVV
jgi:hypothetical protein